MSMTQTIRRTAAVALLAALPVLAAPTAQAAEADRTAVVADAGWGAAQVAEPTAETSAAAADAGWG
ncbi:hypothetical protein ACFRH6_17115 [Streptomyces sp. NPDC056749]|uniref:hypothetical protein n=1 Tax=Streptomyces sp. NPDC056749 TaxID=3345936 RepID=UPI003687F4C0